MQHLRPSLLNKGKSFELKTNSLNLTLVKESMQTSNPYASPYAVAQSPENVRAEFYKKTYIHLAGAVGGLVLLEAFLLSTPAISVPLINLMVGGKYSWFVVLGLFMAASFLAEKWAHSSTSKTMQYAGLALTVVAYGIVFLPILFIAQTQFGHANIIGQAGIITAALFGGLTFIAFTTKKDFTFLGGILKVGGFVAIGLIAASMLMGFNLGLFFSGAMVLLMGASILYQTSNIIHHYSSEQYVAASLGLFASVATLFFYVLRILMSFAGDE